MFRGIPVSLCHCYQHGPLKELGHTSIYSATRNISNIVTEDSKMFTSPVALPSFNFINLNRTQFQETRDCRCCKPDQKANCWSSLQAVSGTPVIPKHWHFQFLVEQNLGERYILHPGCTQPAPVQLPFSAALPVLPSIPQVLPSPLSLLFG